MVIFNSYVSLPEGISMLLWDPLGCTTVWFIKYMQDISICTSETKVVWNAEMHGYYAKTIGWQVGQQPPKIKQTKMNQVVFYTSFDLLGMHKYLCSCSQQQATLFLNWVLPTLWEFKGKSSSGFLHQPISLPIFLTWMQLTPVLGVEWVEALDMGEVLRRSSLHRLFWALGAPSMIPPVAVKMSHFGCWWLRNWNTNNITDMKTSVSCGHNQWPHATPPNRAWCSWGETGAAQWTPTTTQHQTIKPSNHHDPSAKNKIANRFRRTPRPSISTPRLHDLREFRPSCLGTQPRSCFAASARHSWDRNALSDRWNPWFHRSNLQLEFSPYEGQELLLIFD